MDGLPATGNARPVATARPEDKQAQAADAKAAPDSKATPPKKVRTSNLAVSLFKGIGNLTGLQKEVIKEKDKGGNESKSSPQVVVPASSASPQPSNHVALMQRSGIKDHP